jgi:hypothetical protein
LSSNSASIDACKTAISWAQPFENAGLSRHPHFHLNLAEA